MAGLTDGSPWWSMVCHTHCKPICCLDLAVMLILIGHEIAISMRTICRLIFSCYPADWERKIVSLWETRRGISLPSASCLVHWLVGTSCDSCVTSLKIFTIPQRRFFRTDHVFCMGDGRPVRWARGISLRSIWFVIGPLTYGLWEQITCHVTKFSRSLGRGFPNCVLKNRIKHHKESGHLNVLNFIYPGSINEVHSILFYLFPNDWRSSIK